MTDGDRPQRPEFPETKVRLIAAIAEADVRTVRRYLKGEAVKGASLRERLAAAVERVRAEQGDGR